MITASIALATAFPLVSLLIYSAGRRRGFKEGAAAERRRRRAAHVRDASQGEHCYTGETWPVAAVAP
jgi:hypothetical protein